MKYFQNLTRGSGDIERTYSPLTSLCDLDLETGCLKPSFYVLCHCGGHVCEIFSETNFQILFVTAIQRIYLLIAYLTHFFALLHKKICFISFQEILMEHIVCKCNL